MNQSNVDSQSGGVESLDTALADLAQETLEESPLGQDTRESGILQEELPSSAPQEKQQNIPGLPWNGPLPPYSYCHPEALVDCLEAEIRYKNSMLEENERLKLVLLVEPLHAAYYRQWVLQSNDIFKNLVRLRYRKQQEKEIAAATVVHGG